MRELDEQTQEILLGSRSGDRLIVYVWYDGQLAYQDALPVDSWKLSYDDTRQIKGTLSIDVHDDSGRLSPWLPDDALGVGGSQLQAIYEVGGGTQVNMGWFRITENSPDDLWKLYRIEDLGHNELDSDVPPDMREISVSQGSSIAVDAEELTVNIKRDRFIAPESPRGSSPTVLGELARITADIVPLNVPDTITDKAISRSVIYERERLDAVEDLISRLDAGWRMNGNGELELYPLSDRASRWRIAGGEGGALVRVSRKQSLDGLDNIFVSDGTKKATNSKGEQVDLPVRGIAMVRHGPLGADGPHGRSTVFRSSPLITSEAIAIADAQTFRDNTLARQTIDLTVTCLPNPALETGDYVTVAQPVLSGERVTLDGRIKTMELSGGAGTVDAMVLTVTCDADLVQRIMRSALRGQFAETD